jgi:anti-sigma factor RsiW
MNCIDVRQHWSLYHDSEGDAELHFQIGEHLAACPECAQWFAHQSRLEGLLDDKLRAGAPSPELWGGVYARCGLVEPARTGHRSWFLALAACLAVAVTLVFLSHRSRPDLRSGLLQASLEHHQRLVSGGVPPEFVSQSDLEVETYLRRQVTFPVRCPPRKDAGFAVEGAGVCRLADQPAAYLAGHVDRAPVSIFVLPRESLERFPIERDATRDGRTHQCQDGFLQIAMSVIDRNAVLVVGEVDAVSLERVLRAYGTYPDHP